MYKTATNMQFPHNQRFRFFLRLNVLLSIFFVSEVFQDYEVDFCIYKVVLQYFNLK